MPTIFSGWGTAWGAAWGGVPLPPGSIYGTATIRLAATGTVVNGAVPPIQPQQPAGGGTSLGVPFRWVPFHPIIKTRPRKKRQADIVLL